MYRHLTWEVVLNFMFMNNYVSDAQFLNAELPNDSSCFACPKVIYSSFCMYKNNNFSIKKIGSNVCLIIDDCKQNPEEGKRRMTMDGNFVLVHRAGAGHSVRDPLHSSKFFLPTQEVEAYVDEMANARASNEVVVALQI